jgi:CubicO group peptidase (beta-lactamase class C family)
MFIVALLLAAALDPVRSQAIESSVRASMAARHIPSVVVRIDQDGKTIYARAFGYRDLANKVEADTATRYQYGSITKQFTAAAILALWGDKKLSLHDRVGKYIPEFAKFPITIEQLLVHTSGLADFASEEWYFRKDFTNPFVGHDELLKWSAAQPLVFTPGTKAEYDNAGYTLLARVVEKASGMKYFDFLHARFFKPLGMTSVAPQSYFTLQPNTAIGYMAGDGAMAKALGLGGADPLVMALPWNIEQVDGAGFLVGDAADLEKWDDALLEHRVLHGDAEKMFYTQGHLTNGEATYAGPENPTTHARAVYCYGGLAFISVLGVTTYGANGGTPGFLSFTVTIPSKHISVTTLSNHGSDIDNSKLTTPIVEAVLK